MLIFAPFCILGGISEPSTRSPKLRIHPGYSLCGMPCHASPSRATPSCFGPQFPGIPPGTPWGILDVPQGYPEGILGDPTGAEPKTQTEIMLERGGSDPEHQPGTCSVQKSVRCKMLFDPVFLHVNTASAGICLVISSALSTSVLSRPAYG